MIVDDIFRWADTVPDRPALVINGRPISYAVLARRVAGLRSWLYEPGVEGPGIALIALHSLSFFWVASLAARALGLTTVAVRSAEATIPAGLPDLRCLIVPAQNAASFENRCAELALDLIGVPNGADATLPRSLDLGLPPGGHILHTSGTTGSYKRLLMNPAFEDGFHARRREVLGIESDCVFQIFNYPPTSGAGYKTPAAVWAVGGTIMCEWGADLVPALRRDGATHAVLGPNMLIRLLAASKGAFPRHQQMQLSLTGGTFTGRQVEEARRRISGRVYNRLSCTEASIFGFTLLESDEDRQWHRLIPGKKVELVDENDRPVPTGMVGRVRVSTAGGPSGYFHHPEETRAFFRDGFFYTGDLGVLRADGRMALHGRATDVVNVEGIKIAPAPIEERLCEALGVEGVCLLSMQDAHANEQVHVVLEAPSPPDRARVAELLRKEIGSAPATIHHVTELPRGETGKLVRSAVRAALSAAAVD